MANIPIDLIQLHILPRLPVKSLIRFKSVSKSWQTWITSPDFVRLHRHHVRSSNKNRFLVILDTPSHNINLHELDSPSVPPPVSYSKITMFVKIVATSEFAILLRCSPYYSKNAFHLNINLISTPTDEIDEYYVLLNPSTGSYYEIPHHCTQSRLNGYHSIYGLYFDEASYDYKIAMISQNKVFAPTKRKAKVYSSKTNSWILIKQQLDGFDGMREVVVIGYLLHTIFYTPNTPYANKIGCFDIMAEKWTNDVPLPNNFMCCRLCVFDVSLCAGTYDISGWNYQVWVMKEYGVKESWVKFLNIDSRDFHNLDYVPVTYREGLGHEILCRLPYNGELFWYDIRSKKTEKVVEPEGCRACISGHIICKESFANFPGGRKINLRQSKIMETRKTERNVKKVETDYKNGFIYQLLERELKIVSLKL